jgi:hypothetical protein
MDLFLNIRHENKWGWFHNFLWWYFHRGIERHRRAKYLRRGSKFHYGVEARVHRDGFVIGRTTWMSATGDYLYVKHKRKHYPIHKLVFYCFGKKVEGKTVVNHVNGDKFHNRWLNLEASTHKENVEHAYRTGLHKKKLTYEQAQEIKNSDKKIKELAGEYGVTYNHIRNIKTGKSWNF